MAGDSSKSESSLTPRPVEQRPVWLRLSLRNPLIQILLFAAFMVVAVLLMTRTLTLPSGVLDENPVGEPAVADIHATRDFVYVEQDVEATAQKRDEAARSVPRVYDFYAEHSEKRRQEIARAFARMRETLQRAELEKQIASTPTPTPEDPDGGIPEPADVVPAEEEPRVALTPEERLKAVEGSRAHFDQALQVIVSDDHFAALARDGFSERAEHALAGITSALLDHHIVANRRLLELEGRRGITIRTLRDGQESSIKRRYDFAEFIDAAEVSDELGRVAPEHLDGISDRRLRAALVSAAGLLIQPNTVYNDQQTEQARQTARDEVQDLFIQKSFRRGQIIVDRGHIVRPQDVRIIAEMEGGDRDVRAARAQLVVGTVVVMLVLMALLFIVARRYLPGFNPTPRDLVFLGAMILLMLGLHQGLGHLLETQEAAWTGAEGNLLRFAIPIALGAMLVRLVLSTEIALIYAVLISMFLGVAADQSLTFGVYALVTSVSAAAAVSKVNRRIDLLIAGLSVGAINALSALAIAMIDGVTEWTLYAWAAGAAFAAGLTAGVLVSALLPVVEWIFNYTTDIKLLELADLNHPALRELFMRAPGSYNHSIMVGNLCKEAAEAIGANPLLARVGAYYHDIGKGKNPGYFAENQRPGQNPHDKLKPNMSALILKAHVKDGLEIARHYGLPREIQDFIAQHHGTSLIAYFYHKAKSLEDPSIPEVDEKDYRYPGPRPQTRETAICLLADGIEAASRAMPEPTHDRLQGLVQKMINKAFADGQLDECDLTLKDLNAIARAFIRVLCGMYHHRPQYPSDKKPARSSATTSSTRRPPAPANGGRKGQSGTQPTLPTITALDAEAPGGRTSFEDRLGANSSEDVRALFSTAQGADAASTFIEDRLSDDPFDAPTPDASASPHDEAQRADHAPDADPQPPGGEPPVAPADQRDSPDPTLDQPLRRLGLS